MKMFTILKIVFKKELCLTHNKNPNTYLRMSAIVTEH